MAMAAEADSGHTIIEAGQEQEFSSPEQQVRLRPFGGEQRLWRELQSRFPGATLYHRNDWLELLTRAYGLSLWLATLHQGAEVLAGCVLARTPLSRRFTALSFSDRCPPLAADPEAAQRLLTGLAAQCPRRRGYEVRGAGNISGWQTVECFVNFQLDLDRPLSRIQNGLAGNFRRNLRRASGQTIVLEHGSTADLLRRFYALQLDSRRRMGLPPQPRHFFELTGEIFGAAGNLDVWVAREDGRDVASAFFVRDGGVIYYKWGARRSNYRSYANHLLFWCAIQEFAQQARVLDLGRTDIRNQGLMRFKTELGATSIPLPCSYYPRAPRHVSAETLTGVRAVLSRLWSQLPLAATRLGGRLLYRFLG